MRCTCAQKKLLENFCALQPKTVPWGDVEHSLGDKTNDASKRVFFPTKLGMEAVANKKIQMHSTVHKQKGLEAADAFHERCVGSMPVRPRPWQQGTGCSGRGAAVVHMMSARCLCNGASI